MKWAVPAAAVAALGAFGLVVRYAPGEHPRVARGPALSVPDASGVAHARLQGCSVCPPPVLDLRRPSEAPAVDGKLHEAAWRDTDARTGAFMLGAEAARPYADARFVRNGDTLYIGLYAADEDVRSGDFFRVTLDDRVTTVSARCAVGGAPVRAACDVDGTVDDPAEDEEWTVELALSIAGADERVPVFVERCEAHGEHCASFTATLALR